MFIDSHYDSDRRLRSLTSRAPADKKNVGNLNCSFAHDLINVVWKGPRERLKAKLLFYGESLIFSVYSGHVLDQSL